MAGLGGAPGDDFANAGRRMYVDRMDSNDQMDRLSTNSEPWLAEGMSVGSGGVSPMMPVSPDPSGRLSEFRDKHARAMELIKSRAASNKGSNNPSRTPSEVGALPSQAPTKERLAAATLQVPSDEAHLHRLSKGSAASDGGASVGSSQAPATQAACHLAREVLRASPSGPISGPPHVFSAPALQTGQQQAGLATPSPRPLEVGGAGSPGAPPPSPPQLAAAQEAALAKIFYERQAASAAKVDWRLAELQQESKGRLSEVQTILEMQAKELASSLLAQQQTSAQLGELRTLIEAQAKEIDGMRSQEVHVSIRAMKESLETFDKMGSRRAQELQLALSQLQDLAGAQARELQELRSQEVSTGLAAVKESLELQSQALMEVAPQTEELRNALGGVRKDIEANAATVAQLRTQAREQHEERLEELRRLRAGMSLQQHEGLLGELDAAHRQLTGQTEAATMSWQLERKQLQDEVARLSGRPPPDAAGLGLQPGAFPPLGPPSRNPSTLALVVAASAGLAAAWLLLRPRQASSAPKGDAHFGFPFCVGPRAAAAPPAAAPRAMLRHRPRRRRA